MNRTAFNLSVAYKWYHCQEVLRIYHFPFSDCCSWQLLADPRLRHSNWLVLRWIKTSHHQLIALWIITQNIFIIDHDQTLVVRNLEFVLVDLSTCTSSQLNATDHSRACASFYQQMIVVRKPAAHHTTIGSKLKVSLMEYALAVR